MSAEFKKTNKAYFGTPELAEEDKRKGAFGEGRSSQKPRNDEV